MSPARWRTGLAAAAVTALLAAAWLFLPRAHSGAGRGPLEVVLVDASASVARAPDWLGWVRRTLLEETGAAEARGAELAVLVYADGAGTAFAPGAPRDFRDRLAGVDGRPFDPRSVVARDGATRLADVLELCAPLLSSGARSRGSLVVLGDGGFTGTSPAPALARLAAAGIELRLDAPPPVRAADVAVLELELPERVESGAPLAARARVLWRRAERDERAWLTVAVERGGERSAFDVELAPSGDEPFDLALDCGAAGAGRTVVEVVAHSDRGADAWPENDRARAATLAEDAHALTVLAPADLEPLARALLVPDGRSAFPGLELDFVAVEDAASALTASAALVTFDVAPSALPAPLVRDFVARGGGWLAFAGWSFLADQLPDAAPAALAELLPLERTARELGPRDVVLLTDGSGSMEGAPFETLRAAALDLVRGALSADRVLLRFFTAGLEPEVLLKPRDAGADGAERAARELLRLRVPSGTTHLLRSLDGFAETLTGTDTLVFLLSDGREREPQGDVLARARDLAARIAAAHARLVVVAVGDADRELLAALAGADERVLSGATLGDLRAVFQRELRAGEVLEGPLAVRALPRAVGSIAAEVEGVSAGASGLPPLQRLARARLRPGAELLWASANDETDEPVLAVQRVGAGRTALVATLPLDDSAGWGPAWTGAEGRAALEPLLRWIAREPPAARALTARVDGRTLALDGLDESWPAVVTGRLVEARSGAELASALELFPPSALGADPLLRREGELGAAPESDVVLELDGPGDPVLEVERGLADEFAHREGRVRLPDPAAVASAEDGSRSASRALAPWLLGLGLFLVATAALVRNRP